jgi:hypothetical protein
MTTDTGRNDGNVPEAVLRLCGGGAASYLGAHHVEAATRLTRLFSRASLRQRVTMSYDPARVGKSAGPVQADIAHSAADARRALNDLARHVPPDCWSMLVDICLHDRGLQDIEMARHWPRRSAKLVLRIGLDQVASRLGLAEAASGSERRSVQIWLPERPPMFPDTI